MDILTGELSLHRMYVIEAYYYLQVYIDHNVSVCMTLYCQLLEPFTYLSSCFKKM